MNEDKVKKAIERLNSPDYQISFSQWTNFVQSPRHLLRYLSGEDMVGPAAHFSRKLHVLILEGKEAFDEKYVINEKGVVTNSYNERMFIKEMVRMGLGELVDGVYEGGEMDYVEAYRMSYEAAKKSEAKIESEGREKWNKFKEWINLKVRAKKSGREIVGKKDYGLMLSAREVFNDDLDMVRLYKGGVEFEKEGNCEVVIEAPRRDNGEKVGEDFKMKVRGRLDIVGENKEGRYICDLKYLASAGTRQVMRKVVDDWLYVQGGLYSEMEGLKDSESGEDGDKYYLLVLDKAGNSNIFELSEELRRRGMDKFKEYLIWFRFCKRVNGWRRSYNFFSDRGDGTFLVNPPWWMENGR